MPSALRRLVQRACHVCEWRGQSIEVAAEPVECPWCHALTRVLGEEWLIPVVAGTNPYAAALGRLGASKGGTVRAERLPPSRRREIARKAARARWRRR
jgi:hypothetical protein